MPCLLRSIHRSNCFSSEQSQWNPELKRRWNGDGNAHTALVIILASFGAVIGVAIFWYWVKYSSSCSQPRPRNRMSSKRVYRQVSPLAQPVGMNWPQPPEAAVLDNECRSHCAPRPPPPPPPPPSYHQFIPSDSQRLSRAELSKFGRDVSRHQSQRSRTLPAERHRGRDEAPSRYQARPDSAQQIPPVEHEWTEYRAPHPWAGRRVSAPANPLTSRFQVRNDPPPYGSLRESGYASETIRTDRAEIYYPSYPTERGNPQPSPALQYRRAGSDAYSYQIRRDDSHPGLVPREYRDEGEAPPPPNRQGRVNPRRSAFNVTGVHSPLAPQRVPSLSSDKLSFTRRDLWRRDIDALGHDRRAHRGQRRPGGSSRRQ